MAVKTGLPMGIENFKQIRTGGFYYVDKTGLIRELLEGAAYVNLLTRPRRFGKTLNMSMLNCFFETGSDPALFEGLEITKEKAICEIIGNELLRFPFLAESDRLTETEQRR